MAKRKPKAKPAETSTSGPGPSPPKKSAPRAASKSIVATCKKCQGVTSDAYAVSTKSEAMDLCWHKDGCPGGHDDRTFNFS